MYDSLIVHSIIVTILTVIVNVVWFIKRIVGVGQGMFGSSWCLFLVGVGVGCMVGAVGAGVSLVLIGIIGLSAIFVLVLRSKLFCPKARPDFRVRAYQQSAP